MSREIISKDKLFSEFEAICRQYSTLNEKRDDDTRVASLLDYFIDVAKNVSSRKSGHPEEIFELTKTNLYPEKIAELADSFGMMIVKIEARELRLIKAIEDLKTSNQVIQEEMEKNRTLEIAKNKELAAKILVMAERREKVLSELDNLFDYQAKDLNDYRNKVRHSIRVIRQQYESNSEWKEFESYFLQVHDRFYKKLSRKCPNLTSRELRLCAFLKLKMNTKEIANLTNLSVKTVEVYRSQLRQKLGIPKDTSLVRFISEI